MRRRFLPLAGAAGQTIAVGQCFETDVAHEISWAPKHRLLGQASESDLAQAITSRKTLALGQASETDLAQGITPFKSYGVGQCAETDAAQPITSRKVKAVGQASETDLAQAIVRIIAVALAQAGETDLAQAITASKVKALGQASETDTAQAIAVVGQIIGTINQALETDAAQSISWVPKIRIVGLAQEIDTAGVISPPGVEEAPGATPGWTIPARRGRVPRKRELEEEIRRQRELLGISVPEEEGAAEVISMEERRALSNKDALLLLLMAA